MRVKVERTYKELHRFEYMDKEDLPKGAHQCICLLYKENRCDAWVLSPDKPLCNQCMEHKHKEKSFFTAVVPKLN